MTEHRGFTCDGGCDSTVVLGPHDSLARKGWFTVYGPEGSRTLHCCQSACVLAAMRTYHPVALRDHVTVTDAAGNTLIDREVRT